MGGFASVFLIIVLLHNISVVMFGYFLSGFLCREQNLWFYQLWKSPKSWSSKAASGHLLWGLYNVGIMFFFYEMLIFFLPDVTEFKFVSSLYRILRLWWHQDGFFSGVFFVKFEMSVCVLFGQPWVELSHGFHFCPVSFLLLNYELWP